MQLASQRAHWERLTTWSARVRATRIYTLDGGWRDVQVDENAKVKIATRVAIDHEGHVLGGRICEGDFHEDNYIAELAAQLDALTDAVARGSEERVIIVFDATSPVRAMLRFGRLGARARGDRLAAELLEHFERLRRRVADSRCWSFYGRRRMLVNQQTSGQTSCATSLGSTMTTPSREGASSLHR